MLSRSLAPLCLALFATPALAQDTLELNAHNLHPAALDGDVRSSLYVHRPTAFERGAWYVGGVVEFAEKPMLVLKEFPDGTVERQQGLDDVLAINAGGGYAVHRNVRLQLAVPLFLTSEDTNGRHGPALGDTRLDAQFVLQQPKTDGAVGLALQPFFTLPTGASKRWLGDTGVTGGGLFDATIERGKWTVSGGLGAHFTSKLDPEIAENITGADRMLTEFGVGYLIKDDMGLHAETRMASALTKNERKGTGSPGEVALSLRKRAESGAWWTAGLSVPTTRGVSAAALRVFLGGGFGKSEGTPRDPDGDGIFGKDDACPDQPETMNGLKDLDGCPDGLPGLVVHVTHNERPVQGADVELTGDAGREHYQTSDQVIRKEVMPSTSWTATAKKGVCLEGSGEATVGEGDTTLDIALKPIDDAAAKVIVIDTDGDPVPNAKLAWTSSEEACVPTTPSDVNKDGEATMNMGPGMHKVLATAPGYRMVDVPAELKRGETAEITITLAKTKIKVEAARIVILDKVHFETNKAIIKPDSYALLDEVSDTIRLNPQIGTIEVAGHTDSQGGEASNLDLSLRRAQAVVAYVVAKGVSKDRLVSVGFGETKPIDSNNTRSGRANNRRVEFNIIK